MNQTALLVYFSSCFCFLVLDDAFFVSLAVAVVVCASPLKLGDLAAVGQRVIILRLTPTVTPHH